MGDFDTDALFGAFDVDQLKPRPAARPQKRAPDPPIQQEQSAKKIKAGDAVRAAAFYVPAS